VNCPFCHFPNEHNAPFCVNCGAPLPTGQSQARQVQPQPVQPQPPQPPPEPPQPAAPYPPATQGPLPAQEQAPLPDTMPPGTFGQPEPAAPVQPYPQPAAAGQPQVPRISQAAMVQPPKKKSKGCVIAVVVLGGIFLLLLIGAALVYFLWYRSLQSAALDRVEAEKVLVEKVKETEKTEKKEVKSGEKTGGKEPPETKPADEKEDKVEPPPSGEKAAAQENPILKKTSVKDLYQSQVFLQNDKIKYAGATISIRSDARVLSPADLGKGAKLKKGMVAVGIEVVFEGKAKMKKFKVSLIDGSGKKNSPEDSVEKVMPLPDVDGETHMLWKKLKKPKKKKTYYLHRGFSIPKEDAENLIVEISNLNIDRTLWVKVTAGK
jgi:hypothetical protein